MAMLERRSAPSLWHNRSFSIFWTGQTLSALGDAFALIALPLLVFQATGSVLQMGLVTGVSGLGQLVAALVAGAIVDRVDRRRLMIRCDLLRLGLYAAIPLGWWWAGPHVWLLYAVAGPGAALGMCFLVAYNTAVVNLVDPDQITAANGRLQVTWSLAYVGGPVLAGLVSARFGPTVALGIDALSFALSAGSLAAIRLRPSLPPPSQVEDPRPALLTGFALGVRFLWRHPTLRAVTAMLTAFSLLTGGVVDLFIFHLKHDLGQSDHAVGVVFGLAFLGGVLAGLLAPLVRRRLGFGPGWLGGFALAGIALIAVGRATSVAAIAVLAMLFVWGQIGFGINSMSLRQQVTPDHLLGRVTAAFWTLTFAPASLGAALATGLASRLGAPATLVLLGLGVTLLTGGGLLTPARSRHPEVMGGDAAPPLAPREDDAPAESLATYPA